MRHDVAPTRQEVTDRLLLPREAAPLALVLPLRRIAPQSALHACNLIASPGGGEPFRCEWCAVIAERRRWRLGGEPPPTNLHHPPPTSPTCRCLVPKHLRESDDPSGDADDDPEKAQVVAHAGAFLRDHQLIAVLHVQIVEGAPLGDGTGACVALEELTFAPFPPHLSCCRGLTRTTSCRDVVCLER